MLTFKVGRAMTLDKRDVATGDDGLPLLDGARDVFKSLTRDTVNTSHKVMWGVGRFLLSTGESVNFVWDAVLNTLVDLLKTGGRAYGAIADSVAGVPVIGYGASGVREAIRASLTAMESNARHDTETRKQAFAELNAKLTESGSRLSGHTPGTVVFPAN